MEIKIELSERAIKRLEELRENNYFEELTQSQVIEDLIDTSFLAYRESVKIEG